MSEESFVRAGGHRLEYRFAGTQGGESRLPTIVMLHEGLGSVALWKDFPERLAASTGCRTLAYSRRGYGRSDPLAGSRAPGFMHDEALIVLPELLERLDVEAPLLFGHSDGGSIALIRAAHAPHATRGVVALAPHVMVEEASIAGITAAKQRYLTSDWREKLRPYHDDPDSAFWGWNDIWLHPDFRAWSIEALLPRIECPVLAIQGYDDEFGTMDQVDRIAAGAPRVELLKLHGCGHSPHRDQPGRVLAAVASFVQRLA